MDLYTQNHLHFHTHAQKYFPYTHTLKTTYIEKMFVLKNYLYSKVACV
jgi:hypothetical protein